MRSSGSRARARLNAGALIVGFAVPLAASSPTLGVSINQARGFLRYSAWDQLHETGENAVVAMLEGGYPLASHMSLTGSVRQELSWPYTNFPEPNPQIIPGGRHWNSTHATAVASAIVGNGRGVTQVNGFAPDVTLLAGSITSGIDPTSGGFADVTATSVLFPLFAYTDQGVANSVAAALGQEPWPVASVVNLSFGRKGTPEKMGEDDLSRACNIVAYMTGATIVSAVGDDGMDPPPPNQMSPVGTVRGPASGFNVISVGRTEVDYTSVSADSSGGLMPVIEWAVAARLIDPSAPIDPMNPPPSVEQIFEQRPGVSIVAPGTNLTLATSLTNPIDHPSATAFSDFWTGTSFSTAIVSSGAALVHSLGTSANLWPHRLSDGGGPPRPNGLATKAVLINSARKLAFDNMSRPDPQTLAIITTQGLDSDEGGGQIDFERLLNQFYFASVRDLKSLPGLKLDPVTKNYSIPAFGTNPDEPFVTAFIPSHAPEPDVFPTLGGPGPLLGPDTGPTDRTRMPILGSPARGTPADGVIRGVEPLQLGGGGREPDLNPPRDPDLGGTSPAPVPPDPFPNPGGPSTGGSGPGGNLFIAGWDVGNIGLGTIDVPIGAVTVGSTITVTLCWNRAEKMSIPNFAGPLTRIDPNLVIPPAFQRPAGSGRAALAATPAPPVDGVRSTLRPHGSKYHSIDSSGKCTCGAAHTVFPRPDGTMLTGVEADNAVAELFRSKMSEPRTVVTAPATRAAGLRVEYLLSPAVAADPEFVAALRAASSVWESVIRTPVTLRMSVDFTSGISPVIAQTGLSLVGETYPLVRQKLVAKASSPEAALIGGLPMGVANFDGPSGPFSTDDSQVVLFSAANGKALGFDLSGVLGDPPAPDAEIVFNTDFFFDKDPSDGITQGTIDLVYVMVHELGHALGFVSAVGETPPMPAILDLFRFNTPSAGPPVNTLSDFMSRSREFRAGAEAVFTAADAIIGIRQGLTRNYPYRMSTGRSASGVGDGRQPSHWKDNFLINLTTEIGVMDPTYSTAARNPGLVSQADLLALSLIGWDADFASAPASGPTQVPIIDFAPIGSPTSTVTAPTNRGVPAGAPVVSIGTELGYSDLSLELYRRSLGDGGANKLIAASRSEWANVEHITVSGNPIQPGQYFVRILYTKVRFDLGGYIISTSPSLAIPGYRNLPEAQVEYGLAWYVDLTRQAGQPLQGGNGDDGLPLLAGDINLDGAVNANDLGILLSLYGTTDGAGDLNLDGHVDSADLALILGNFGATR